jgi:hypothetical protein
VLVSPQWIQRVRWRESAIHVNLTREQLKGAPLHDSCADVNREQEIRILGHYGRRGYWESAAGDL